MEHNQGLGLVTSSDFINEFNSVSAKGLPGTSGTGNYKGWRTAEWVIRRNRSEERVLDCGFVASAGTLYTSAEMVKCGDGVSQSEAHRVRVCRLVFTSASHQTKEHGPHRLKLYDI